MEATTRWKSSVILTNFVLMSFKENSERHQIRTHHFQRLLKRQHIVSYNIFRVQSVPWWHALRVHSLDELSWMKNMMSSSHARNAAEPELFRTRKVHEHGLQDQVALVMCWRSRRPWCWIMSNLLTTKCQCCLLGLFVKNETFSSAAALPRLL